LCEWKLPFKEGSNEIIAEEYGLAKAVVKSTIVTVNNDEGILIDFTPIEGKPVLNALQLKSLDRKKLALKYWVKCIIYFSISATFP
jgi:hypothetical protein